MNTRLQSTRVGRDTPCAPRRGFVAARAERRALPSMCSLAHVRRTAFTLVELLVVIGIIGILASLILASLARGKEKARGVACLGHLKQLGLGFALYLDENNNNFPAPGSKTLYGPLPEDWIYWQVARDPKQSVLAPYIASGYFATNLFRCPSDGAARELERGNRSTDPYIYSYSMTSYLPTNNINPGTSLALDAARNYLPFNAASVRNPSGKILLAEEDRDAPPDGLNDGRWVPNINPLTTRHNGRGNAMFIDGHVESVLPKFALNPTNSLPEL